MKRLRVLLTGLFIAALSISYVAAQDPPDPCGDAAPLPAGGVCPNGAQNGFSAVPLMDGTGLSYGDPDNNLVSLYGAYGNNENVPTTPESHAHYQAGITAANSIVLRCTDGSTTLPCNDGNPQAIVFLFIGFSNCDIEICGGNADVWDQQDLHQTHLVGQPCATSCPNRNLNNPGAPPWNQVTRHGSDGVTQQSFLYQVYPPPPQPSLVGPHVVVFNGALGTQTLDRWDTTPTGYYDQNGGCNASHTDAFDPECNYTRVHFDLLANGYSDNQVQAVFIKSADGYPQCDLNHSMHPACSHDPLPDAYQAEQHLGNILRYLKCCTLNPYTDQSTGIPRYPNLQQVFVTSRIYGGYATGVHGCLNPEPFAYEEGFSVQRLITAQIRQAYGINSPDPYSGQVDYTVAPWVDWGPYLWASGETTRSDGLFWCNNQNDQKCNTVHDVRWGDPADQVHFWGDFTHPTANAEMKVAGQLVNFITGATASPWVTPWIQK